MKVNDFFRKVRNHVFLHKDPHFVCTPEIFESYGQLIGVPKDKIYRHYLFCIYRYGVKPDQYVLWDFYRKNNRSRNRYVGDKKNNRVCTKVNPMRKQLGSNNCFIDKITFNKVFSDFIHRAWISTETSVEEIARFLEAHDKVIVKPIDGGGVWNIYP